MTTVFTLAGAFGSPLLMPLMLGGSITNGNTVVPVWYPNWTIFEAQVAQGAKMLDDNFHSTSGKKRCLAHSLGSVVCCYWLQNYGPTSSISPSELDFVLLGNSMRKYGGLCYVWNYYPNSKIPDDTPYTVTDFARQYDGWADWPTGGGANMYIAEMNAVAGQANVHGYYNDVRLDDPNVGSYQEGNITYMWDETDIIPLAGRIKNSLTEPWDTWLRPMIESAYDRPIGTFNASEVVVGSEILQAKAQLYLPSIVGGRGKPIASRPMRATVAVLAPSIMTGASVAFSAEKLSATTAVKVPRQSTGVTVTATPMKASGEMLSGTTYASNGLLIEAGTMSANAQVKPPSISTERSNVVETTPMRATAQAVTPSVVAKEYVDFSAAVMRATGHAFTPDVSYGMAFDVDAAIKATAKILTPETVAGANVSAPAMKADASLGVSSVEADRYIDFQASAASATVSTPVPTIGTGVGISVDELAASATMNSAVIEFGVSIIASTLSALAQLPAPATGGGVTASATPAEADVTMATPDVIAYAIAAGQIMAASADVLVPSVEAIRTVDFSSPVMGATAHMPVAEMNAASIATRPMGAISNMVHPKVSTGVTHDAEVAKALAHLVSGFVIEGVTVDADVASALAQAFAATVSTGLNVAALNMVAHTRLHKPTTIAVRTVSLTAPVSTASAKMNMPVVEAGTSPHNPETTGFTADDVYTPPSWFRDGVDYLDVIGVSDGGAGGGYYFFTPGTGGSAGTWATATIQVLAQLTITVGQGGAWDSSSNNGGDGTGILVTRPTEVPSQPITVISADGGAGGPQGGGTSTDINAGDSPGNKTYQGVEYVGGEATIGSATSSADAEDGNPPGGGGEGAVKGGAGGGHGATGKVWVVARQNPTGVIDP